MKAIAPLCLSALLATAAASTAALAHAHCDRGLSATGRMPNGLNFEPPRIYDTTGLARTRAIAGWKHKVAAQCLQYSSFWWRAHAKHVECEGYAGGVSCEVTARPARKLLGS
jgi:hypothetical protein